jgi:hypothetical protein
VYFSKVPPYGRLLADRLEGGWRPRNGTIFIACGAGAWRMCKKWGQNNHRAFLCLPPGQDPAVFDWARLVAGSEVVLYAFPGFSEPDIEHFAALLIHAGADLVVAILDAGGRFSPLIAFHPLRERESNESAHH